MMFDFVSLFLGPPNRRVNRFVKPISTGERDNDSGPRYNIFLKV